MHLYHFLWGNHKEPTACDSIDYTWSVVFEEFIFVVPASCFFRFHIQIAECLAESGADVNARNNDGKSPMQLALENCTTDSARELEFARSLVRHGLDVRWELGKAEEKGKSHLVQFFRSQL